jgi:hypothetical protein
MTQTKTANEAEATAERLRDLNEQVLELGRKAGVSLLDGYESTAKTVADYQDKLADQAKVEWIASAARAQANFTREVSKVYANTGRELLVK